MKKIIIMFSIILASCNSYVKFKPILFNGENFQIDNEHISNDYNQRIIKVFKYYKVNFRVDGDSTIWINKKVMKNKELIWNYTTKANDLEWLRNHSE